MTITRIPNTRSAAVSRKARRLAVKSKRLAAKRAKASAVVVEPASFKMRLLRGAGGLAFAVAAAPFRFILSRASGTTQAKSIDSSESAKYERRIAKLKRHHALLDMARAEHALNMARIEFERRDAKLEQLAVPPSLWSQVSTAAMYVGIGAVVASNPGATYAVANAAVIAGRYAGRYALAMAF